jgi:signal recognition particle GTPase
MLENLEPEDMEVLREFLGSKTTKPKEPERPEGTELLETIPQKDLDKFYNQIKVLNRCEGFSEKKEMEICVNIQVTANVLYNIKKGKIVFDKSALVETIDNAEDYSDATLTQVHEDNQDLQNRLNKVQVEINKLRARAKEICEKHNLKVHELLYDFREELIDLNVDYGCVNNVCDALEGLKLERKNVRNACLGFGVVKDESVENIDKFDKNDVQES